MAEAIWPFLRRLAARAPRRGITLESLTFESDHGLLKGCHGQTDWSNAGAACPEPEWTAAGASPVSMSMGKPIVVRLRFSVPRGEHRAAPITVRGSGPDGISFESSALRLTAGPGAISMSSSKDLERRIQKLELDVRWHAGSGAPREGALASPTVTSNVVYVTMDRPKDDLQGTLQEDGVTLKRMDRAVSWVAPLKTLDPHTIVSALMAKFPYYTLKPNPKVPRAYRHPTYFNRVGGAWPMSDYVEETGECQAIVRLVRGILRQLGIPGDARVVAIWADPNDEEGRKALSADLEERPASGLDTTKVVDGRLWHAALVDSPVDEGKTYPASHTRMSDGRLSPGLNRYEACLEFSHGGSTKYYAGGAGVFLDRQEIIRVFWGLIWFSSTADDGYRVEKIVRRYGQEGVA